MRKKQADKPVIIFIASESRSGSTLLDFLVGNHPHCTSVGEMRRLQGFARQDHELINMRDRSYPLLCTCGQPIDQCEFWNAVEANSRLSFKDTPFQGQAAAFWKKWIQIAYLIGGERLVRWSGHWLPPIKRELQIANNCYQVYGAVSAVTGASYIVDSSKDIYHYILLRIAEPQRVRLITLYRDGRAVAYSQVRGKRVELWQSNDKLSPFEQAVKHWVRVNRNIKLFSMRTPKREKFVVRYENLCANPYTTLKHLFNHFHIDCTGVVLELCKTDKHNIGGSPSRTDPSLSTIRLDERWKQELSPQHLRDFERLGGRMNRSLGYQ